MEIAGVVLALPSLVKLCVETSHSIQRIIQTYRKAGEHRQLQKLCLSVTDGQLSEIFRLFERPDVEIDASFAVTIAELTKRITDGLERAGRLLPYDGFDASVTSKTKYAVRGERKLKEAINDTERWMERLVTRVVSWLMIQVYSRSQTEGDLAPLRVTSADFRTKAPRLAEIMVHRRNISGPILDANLRNGHMVRVEKSALWLKVLGDHETELVEYRSYQGMDPASVERVRAIVRDIATDLRKVDHGIMRILECRAFSDEIENQRFAIHFIVPTAVGIPQTLRSMLSNPINRNGKKHSLSDRLKLARSVAKAVLYIHACKFVHKNIRPDNILVFDELAMEAPNSPPESSYPYKIGPAYLCGYDGVRPEDANSVSVHDLTWQQMIYLPPERLLHEGDRPLFSWRHDVYSLGVTLLEVALWEDLTSRDNNLGKTLQKSTDYSTTIKKIAKQVPRVMGDLYFDAVLSCLNMLRGSDFDPTDEDGVVLGTAYMSDVLDRLEAIQL